VLKAFGRTAKGPGRISLVGGCSAVELVTRESTIDIDIKMSPEPEGIFEGIASIDTTAPTLIEQYSC